MMKRVLASLVAIGMATQLAGCTSSGPKEETDAATSPDASEFSDESKGDFTDGVKNAEGGDAVKPPGDVAAAPVDGAGDNLDLDAPVDAPADTAAANPTPDKGGDLSLEDADPEHEFPENVAQAPPSTDAPPADAQAAAPAPTDEQLFAAKPSDEAKPQDAASQAAPEPPLAAEAKPVRAVVFAPLMKVKDQPFSQKGALLNRVYIARQTDTWKGVSAKVYGSDKAKDLKRWNPGIASRALKVGDKVYYNSPKDPSDNSRMLSYYEEQGTPAQVYTTKDGDNLRKVGKDLLGDKDSWKELWVTNRDLASKGALPAGVDVKYWNDAAGAGAPAQTMASQQPPADGMVPPNVQPGAPTGAPPDMMDPTGMTAPQPTSQAANSPPPPQPPPATVAATTPMPEVPPPPVAPAAPKKAAKAEPSEPATGDQDMMFWLAASGIMLLAAAGTFIVIRKNRARRIDLSQTQV